MAQNKKELQFELFTLDETFPKTKPKRYTVDMKIVNWGVLNAKENPSILDNERDEIAFTVKDSIRHDYNHVVPFETTVLVSGKKAR